MIIAISSELSELGKVKKEQDPYALQAIKAADGRKLHVDYILNPFAIIDEDELNPIPHPIDGLNGNLQGGGDGLNGGMTSLTRHGVNVKVNVSDVSALINIILGIK